MMFALIALPIFALAAPDQNIVGDAEQFLSQFHHEDVDSLELQQAAVQGMLNHIDQKTGLGKSEVLTKQEMEYFVRHKSGIRNGYGLSVRIQEGQGLWVDKLVPGGSAERSGLKEDDVIVAINKHPFTGLSAEEMMQLLHQSDQEMTIFAVKRNNSLFHYEIQTSSYQIENVTTTNQMIVINYFGLGTFDQLKKALERQQGGIILDLRDNSGGLLQEASLAASIFTGPDMILGHRLLPDGTSSPIMSVDLSSDSLRLVYNDNSNSLEGDSAGSIVCLVNQGTAGVAEFFVSALKHHNGAILVGRATRGQAAEEYIHPLTEQLFLKMADIELLNPVQQSWNSKGLKPQVVVYPVEQVSLEGALEAPVDIQLQMAIQLQQ